MADHGGFHEGEIAVQRRAGVQHLADRLSGMLDPADLAGGASSFLAARKLAVLTARDGAGRLWTSPLTGPPGFLAGTDTTLHIHASLAKEDPLVELPSDQAVGLVAIDFATRRRMRVNGTLIARTDVGLELRVEQAYGNCPQYIQTRQLEDTHPGAADPRSHSKTADSLTAENIELIRNADTFFLGTVHPMRGADSSHRGGPRGFVRVHDAGLWWPDYPGNNMFNSLGNLAVDDSAALLFLDFVTGATLHLSGKANLLWTVPGIAGDDGGTGRRVQFTPQVINAGGSFLLRTPDVAYYPRNPPLTDKTSNRSAR